jgi:GT2 family glycosyltransferase
MDNKGIKNSIVVSVYNKSALTRRCFDSVLENSSPQTREMWVVDNHSTDDTATVLLEYQARFRGAGWSFEITTNNKNVGFGRAINQLTPLVRTPVFSILNNDTWLMPKWDAVLLRRLQELEVDMISPYAWEKPFQDGEMDKVAAIYTTQNRNKWRSSWNSILMMFRTESFRKTKAFDERYYLTYEDVDLRETMLRAGQKFAQIGDCFIWHQSRGSRDSNPVVPDYEQRARELFIEKWGFDPVVLERRQLAKLKRSWQKWKDKRGLF